MVKRDLITSILLILSTILIFVLLRTFVYTTYTVQEKDSNSFIATGDYITLVKEEKPDYNDFVLYEVDGKPYVGRVMAQGGDKLASVEDILYRNNEVVEQTFLSKLQTPYLADLSHELPFTEDFSLDTLLGQLDATVPEDNYIILNDNRQNKEDSRQFGLIPRSRIKGVLTFRLYPLDKFGFLTVE